MKKLLVILVYIIGQIQSSKADTIDFCTLYYNQAIYSENVLNREIELTIDNIKDEDMLGVIYLTDRGFCESCSPVLTIENAKHKTIMIITGNNGTWEPIFFSLKSLVEINKLEGDAIFDIFYLLDTRARKDKRLIFRIKLH